MKNFGFQKYFKNPKFMFPNFDSLVIVPHERTCQPAGLEVPEALSPGLLPAAGLVPPTENAF